LQNIHTILFRPLFCFIKIVFYFLEQSHPGKIFLFTKGLCRAPKVLMDMKWNLQHHDDEKVARCSFILFVKKL